MIISKIARNEIWVLVWMCLASTTAEGPRCPQGATTDQCREDLFLSNMYFYTVNGVNLEVSYGPTYYHLACPNNLSLEYEALPRFATAVNVSNVWLTSCAPPPHGYAAALRMLGVSSRSLELKWWLPVRPALAAAHLRGLEMDELTLTASSTAPLWLDPAVVESLANLITLRLNNVRLTRAAALLLPPTLRSLSLHGDGVAELPAEMFGRLPALNNFMLNDALVHELDLSEAAALRSIELSAHIAGVTLGPSVVSVMLNWVRGAALLGNCSSLQKVIVKDSEEPLPARWLAACPAMREVSVYCRRTMLLRADLLIGARALRDLTVRHCGLHELPPQWLTEATELVALDLSYNDLQWLPSELASAAALERVNLAGNRLSAAALEVLGALPVLRHLSLDGNPLGDLCGSGHVFDANALSPLRRARGLRTLSLARTGLTRICRDWRSELEWLTDLDLRHNNVTLLEFEDLQWRRRNATLVHLSGNPVRGVHYTREQFTAVLAGNVSSDFASSQMTTLWLDDDWPQCDCAWYWFVRATSERPLHARAALRGARCGTRAGLEGADTRAGLEGADTRAGLEGADTRTLQCTLPPRAGLTRVPRALSYEDSQIEEWIQHFDEYYPGANLDSIFEKSCKEGGMVEQQLLRLCKDASYVIFKRKLYDYEQLLSSRGAAGPRVTEVRIIFLIFCTFFLIKING